MAVAVVKKLASYRKIGARRKANAPQWASVAKKFRQNLPLGGVSCLSPDHFPERQRRRAAFGAWYLALCALHCNFHEQIKGFFMRM